jgi:hypothetical protein
MKKRDRRPICFLHSDFHLFYFNFRDSGSNANGKARMVQTTAAPEYAQLKRLLPDEPWFEAYKVAPDVCDLRAAPVGGSHLLPDCRPEASSAFDTGMASPISTKSFRG